jgi:glutathione S-transferase
MKLLISPASPFVRKVRVLLREAGGLPLVEEVAVATTPLATDPAIVAANPTGRIPVLIRPDGPALVDSRVICRFLDHHLGAGLYPEARVWEVLTLEALADGMADSAVSIAYEVRLRPEERRFEPWIEAQWGKVSRGLDALEARWLSHLAGPLDMGQVAVACLLGYLDLRHDARGWRRERPGLAAWAARVAERPSLRDTAPPA